MNPTPNQIIIDCLLIAGLGLAYLVTIYTTGKHNARIEKLEKLIESELERQRHFGWNEGREYQIELTRRNRDAQGRFN